jgi:hypothetical protein
MFELKLILPPTSNFLILLDPTSGVSSVPSIKFLILFSSMSKPFTMWPAYAA